MIGFPLGIAKDESVFRHNEIFEGNLIATIVVVDVVVDAVDVVVVVVLVVVIVMIVLTKPTSQG